MDEQPPVVPVGAVLITQREIYDKIVAIEQAVTGLPGRVEKLENQVDAIRTKLLMWTGAGTTAGLVVGSVVQRVVGA